MRRGRPPYAEDPAAMQRPNAFFGEMLAPHTSTNSASRLASVLGGRARSRDPSPSARRVATHAVAFGTTLRSPRVSPHVTPRATPTSSPLKARTGRSAADRYLARAREREVPVVRRDEGEGDDSDENRSDLFELSDDSVDDGLGAAFPSHASSRGRRRARSPGRSKPPTPSSLEAAGRVDGRSRRGEGGGASPAPAPRRARRRVAFAQETPETPSAPPEPRGATSVPRPVAAARAAAANPMSLRERLPRKPELARPAAVAAELRSGDHAVATDAVVSDDGTSSSVFSGVDAPELSTPSPEPTRIASRAFEDGEDGARFSFPAAARREARAPNALTLIDSIAQKGSGDLLASVAPTAASDSAADSTVTTRSVSFGVPSAGDDAGPVSPRGAAAPRAAGHRGKSPSSLREAFASEMFASPLSDGRERAFERARSPLSADSEASARSASGSAAKAAAAAARRRFALAAAVMGDAARFDVDGRRREDARDGAVRSRETETADRFGEPAPLGASLVAELLDVSRALGEETLARAAEEAARKLAVSSARAEARVRALSEEHRAKLARRESAHRLRAACRALRFRVRQWRATASTARLVRAAGRKWRAAARRAKAREAYAERKACARAAEARLGVARAALRAWRWRAAERRGMVELARLRANGARRRRTRGAFDAWRDLASSAARARETDVRLSRRGARFACKLGARRRAKAFGAWADAANAALDARRRGEARARRASLLTLGRCANAWFGVSSLRSKPETRALLREAVAEARLRAALRAMADRNRERARIRRWYEAAREPHLRALGHWAATVSRRALASWCALAVEGRRARARWRAHAALKRVVAAQAAERDARAGWLFGKDVSGFAFDEFEFPTPSPLRERRADSPDDSEPARRRPEKDSKGVRWPLRPVGASRLAADAAELSRATARAKTRAAKAGAGSARGAGIKRRFSRGNDEHFSPVSFAGYVSPAAARARLWEAPELSASLRELAPTVWRAAFEDASFAARGAATKGGAGGDSPIESGAEEANAASEAEGEAAVAADRLLELARRGRRRVARYASRGVT